MTNGTALHSCANEQYVCVALLQVEKMCHDSYMARYERPFGVFPDGDACYRALRPAQQSGGPRGHKSGGSDGVDDGLSGGVSGAVQQRPQSRPLLRCEAVGGGVRCE